MQDLTHATLYALRFEVGAHRELTGEVRQGCVCFEKYLCLILSMNLAVMIIFSRISALLKERLLILMSFFSSNCLQQLDALRAFVQLLDLTFAETALAPGLAYLTEYILHFKHLLSDRHLFLTRCYVAI